MLNYNKDMTNIQNKKIAEAKEKACQAWAKWDAYKTEAKEAFFVFREKMKKGDESKAQYEKYLKTCEKREGEYIKAIEADKEAWRFESIEGYRQLKS